MIPSLLRDSARNSSEARTRCGSTGRGIAIPCLAPIILIHMQRALWIWAAIIRTVRRGMPGTAFDHIAGGRFSIRYIVTRLFVRQAAIKERPVSRSVDTFVFLRLWRSDTRLLSRSANTTGVRRAPYHDLRGSLHPHRPVRSAG